ncbi:hypothetical protein EVAR_10809_1 [Eumeta japonica]|uniref:Uncharacterized protein n=1 Tax=Eumeta variegata TaxID=151549 RepID=A0A4C1Y6S1_EUMVA|nr:hypothetical protein EVAR_10809_1 [Eumeta japonica]
MEQMRDRGQNRERDEVGIESGTGIVFEIGIRFMAGTKPEIEIENETESVIMDDCDIGQCQKGFILFKPAKSQEKANA